MTSRDADGPAPGHQPDSAYDEEVVELAVQPGDKPEAKALDGEVRSTGRAAEPGSTPTRMDDS